MDSRPAVAGAGGGRGGDGTGSRKRMVVCGCLWSDEIKLTMAAQV